jgi:hypothetical protein
MAGMRSTVRPARQLADSPMRFTDAEPPRQFWANDTLGTAEPLPGFGTEPNHNSESRSASSSPSSG